MKRFFVASLLSLAFIPSAFASQFLTGLVGGNTVLPGATVQTTCTTGFGVQNVALFLGNPPAGTVGHGIIFHNAGGACPTITVPNTAGVYRLVNNDNQDSYGATYEDWTRPGYGYESQITVTVQLPPPVPLRVSVQNAVTGSVTNLGLAVLAILGLFVGMAVAYLVFRFGFKSIKNFSNSDGAVVGGSDIDWGSMSRSDDYHDNRKYAMMSDEEYSRVDPRIRNQRYSKDFEDIDDMV